VSTTPPHPEASPDRPGAVTVSRIVARNSGHPEPYTGTRTVLVCSSRPRSSAAAAGGGTAPRNPPLRWRGPQGTRNDPDNFGSAAGGSRTRRGSRVHTPPGLRCVYWTCCPGCSGTDGHPRPPGHRGDSCFLGDMRILNWPRRAAWVCIARSIQLHINCKYMVS